MMRRAALACVLAVLLSGCSAGRKPYAEEHGAKNLSVRTATSGSRAALHIHGVDAQCRTQYRGTLDLDQSSLAISIPAERWSYLVVEFRSSGFLGSQRRETSRELLFKPRANHHYEIEATYREDIYNVVLRERPPRGPARELGLMKGERQCPDG